MTAAMHDVWRVVPGRPRLLALGEPTHGEDALLEPRNELARHLIEHEGLRTVALESDCLRGLLVDDYVTSGAGSLDEVMRDGFSHGFGASPANRDLVRWMRAYNRDRPAAEQVRFAGFDGPLENAGGASPRQALTELYGWLAARVDADLLPCTAAQLDELLGADRRWSDPAAQRDPSRSPGRSPEARRLRLLADDLVALLAMQPGDERARLYGRTAVGLLRYHHWMAEPSAGRPAGVLGQRAAMMAANLLALAERGPALVHAGTAHLQRGRSSMRLGGEPVHWWSAGAIVAQRLGERYAVVAMALGTMEHRGVGTPPADTIEGLLYGRGQERCVLDARRLDAAGLTARVSPWRGYAPLDPAQLAGIDAVVFVRDVPRSPGPQWWP
ncbi:erythromycin esterase family protein [Actinoplanes sp. URMC 104]|uniref:erythromycin esterase family protein n=1 Tax=Actinoplanes sp. URMC 104 TaxID=3423409 RepID=UPI003F1B3F3B